jgi:hypothetical protein
MAVLFAGGNLKVTAVSGNTVTVQGTPNACGGGKTAELRRSATGVREFVGDVVSSKKLDGGKYAITFDPGKLPSSTRPSVGESLLIYCSNTKSGGTGTIPGIGSTGDSSVASLPWMWIIGGGLVLWLVTKD